MGVKRALIVDDSKSARAFLSRILEKYDLEVESAESAEQAIEYLGHHHPDVIFMDHQMPGMDGLQAVQVIKNNPRTAMIPIMMYTSQEGEVYLGQARALGAVGVLPKQIKPTDVSKVLYQLHLVPDRRSNDQTTFRAATLEVVAEIGEGDGAPAANRPITEAGLREQLAELRRMLVATLDTHGDRLVADVRTMLEGDEPPIPLPTRPAAHSRRDMAWLIAGAAALVALLSLSLWWQAESQRRELAAQVAQLEGGSALHPARAAAQSAAAAGAASRAGAAQSGPSRAGQKLFGEYKTLVEPVPYGADALGGPRLEVLRQLLDRLAAEGYRGTVEIRSFPGRFCLIGNATDGFSLPPEETAFGRCDWVGVTPGESPLQPQRVPLAFANLTEALRSSTHGAIEVQVSAGEAATTAVPYPAVGESLTAGEWNRAASANNRIEIRVR
jgi:CheY-like chemotaxis protein